jgi:hypothetical protein
MFRRSSDGIAVPASIRLNDGALLVGTINCGMSGKLENLLASEGSFIEFVSKDGQQRFMARHQIASIEPMGTSGPPTLAQPSDDLEPFSVLGLAQDATLEMAKTAFQDQLNIYNPERWTAEDIPFEFSRYAAEKTRQINNAFTSVRAIIQQREEERRKLRSQQPIFGVKAAG